ncbi:hypothetical protein [Desulfovibrio sp. ZJ369]|uniref:hypothetical protein n=1 Tax=Desulfovibrio sp. ZJ369 TaxID=2709793 RepID=UPI0013EC1F8A|nr:hypothetical protein [Desulfovibrio sp. ZJ369]
METFGRLLTPEERQQTKAHFSKNEGLRWDVHDMAEYVKKGFDAVQADEESFSKITNGIQSLGGARAHE